MRDLVEKKQDYYWVRLTGHFEMPVNGIPFPKTSYLIVSGPHEKGESNDTLRSPELGVVEFFASQSLIDYWKSSGQLKGDEPPTFTKFTPPEENS